MVSQINESLTYAYVCGVLLALSRVKLGQSKRPTDPCASAGFIFLCVAHVLAIDVM